MDTKNYEVLVIGAGASGLIAALEIARTGRSVAVLEAGSRAGGRILTISEQGQAVELGAEFVHGNLPLTQELLKSAGAETMPAEGSIWQHKQGLWQKQEDFIEDFEDLEKKFKGLKTDKPVAEFLQQELTDERYRDLRFSLKNYVEGYYAADAAKASTKALCEELTKGDEEQYRIEGGYHLLINYLEKQCCERGVQFFLSQPVLQVNWKKGEVTAVTSKAAFGGKKVLITVPVGVLQNGSISFSPALPHINKAVQQLGFGHVVKLVLQLEAPVWKDKSLTGQKDLSNASFLFSDQEIPTWWTHHPKQNTMLTGWVGGPRAATFRDLSREEMEAKAIFALGRLFNLDTVRLRQKIKKIWYHNWSADDRFCGAYSYDVVDGEKAIQLLQQPVEETVFFAGEGLHRGPAIGTVEGALQSGKKAAQEVTALFSL